MVGDKKLSEVQDELNGLTPATEWVGARIRRRRWEVGMGRAQLADAVDVTRAYLSMIETGKRQPSSARLEAIARALDTDAAELTRPVTNGQVLEWMVQQLMSPGRPSGPPETIEIVAQRGPTQSPTHKGDGDWRARLMQVVDRLSPAALREVALFAEEHLIHEDSDP